MIVATDARIDDLQTELDKQTGSTFVLGAASRIERVPSISLCILRRDLYMQAGGRSISRVESPASDTEMALQTVTE